MLRKFAVALVAASVFTAPVFAQGGGAAATPPVKTETKSGTAGPAASTAATPKVVTANPTLKTAKVKPSKRYVHRHVKPVKHVAYVKPVKHVRYVKPVRHVAYVKPIKHVTHVKPVKHATHVKHVKHVGHVKRVKHVKTAHVRGTTGASQVRHDMSKSTTGQNGATPAPKAKSNVN